MRPIKGLICEWLGITPRINALESHRWYDRGEIDAIVDELQGIQKRLATLEIGHSLQSAKPMVPEIPVVSAAAWKTAIRRLPGYNEQQEADFGQGIQEIQQGIQAGFGTGSEIQAHDAGIAADQAIDQGYGRSGIKEIERIAKDLGLRTEPVLRNIANEYKYFQDSGNSGGNPPRS